MTEHKNNPKASPEEPGEREDWFFEHARCIRWAETRDDHRRITFPPELERLGLIIPDDALYWGTDDVLEVVVICPYKKPLDDTSVFSREKHASVGADRVVTIPSRFFTDFKGPIPGDSYTAKTVRQSMQMPEPYQLKYSTLYYFVTTVPDAVDNICYIIPDNRLEQMVAAAELLRRAAKREQEGVAQSEPTAMAEGDE